jgi:hypothetical protein
MEAKNSCSYCDLSVLTHDTVSMIIENLALRQHCDWATRSKSAASGSSVRMTAHIPVALVRGHLTVTISQHQMIAHILYICI